MECVGRMECVVSGMVECAEGRMDGGGVDGAAEGWSLRKKCRARKYVRIRFFRKFELDQNDLLNQRDSEMMAKGRIRNCFDTIWSVKVSLTTVITLKFPQII